MSEENNKTVLETSAYLATGGHVSKNYLDSTSKLIQELLEKGERKAYLLFGGRVFGEYDTLAEARRIQATAHISFTILDTTGVATSNRPEPGEIIGHLN